MKCTFSKCFSWEMLGKFHKKIIKILISWKKNRTKRWKMQTSVRKKSRIQKKSIQRIQTLRAREVRINRELDIFSHYQKKKKKKENCFLIFSKLFYFHYFLFVNFLFSFNMLFLNVLVIYIDILLCVFQKYIILL